MKVCIISLVFVAALVAPVRGICNGVMTNSSTTQLDFFNSNIAVNELHLQGGELRYGSKCANDDVVE